MAAPSYKDFIPKPKGGDPFDLVRQFDGLRQSQSGAPSSVSSYLPREQPTSTAGPASIGSPPPPSGVGAYPTVQKGSGQGTVNWGGKQVSAALVPYADALKGMGLRFTSGYRDPEHNARVGGVKNSYHTRSGETGALDFVGSAKQMQDGAAWARANGAKEVLIHNVGSGQHLHVGW